MIKNDHNFMYFTNTTFDIDLAEMHFSFNDLIIIQGIVKNMTMMLNDYNLKIENKKREGKVISDWEQYSEMQIDST